MTEKPIAKIIYENTVQAFFQKRLNRFTAEVRLKSRAEEDHTGHGQAADDHAKDSKKEKSRTELVHVKNTGRLKELLLPDAKVTLQKSTNPARKTAYDLISVYKPELGWVNIDSLVPNALMKKELQRRDYDLVRPEFTFGNSRFDFYMEKDGEKYLTEVKGCTLAADIPHGPGLLSTGLTQPIGQAVPPKSSLSPDALPAPTKQVKTGLFPDAPTERGVKHLHELAAAAREGYRCEVAFVIQINGIHMVFPNDRTQPEFGEALKDAMRAGVRVVCYSCHVEADGIEIISHLSYR